MDPSLYHAFYEIEDRHWWFVGRRRIVESLLERALGADAAAAVPGRPAPGVARAAAPVAARAAASAAAASAGAGRAAVPVAEPAAAPAEARRILDVGCGTGGMLPLLSRFGRVTGIDSEPLALEYCRRRGITDVHLQEDFEAPGEFDVVTLFDVLEHVPDEAAFLARLAAFLKPGGLLVVTVPAFEFLWSRHDELNHHQRRYTRRRLVDVLERAGFRVQRASYFNMLLFPAAAAVRVMGGRGSRQPASSQAAPADGAEDGDREDRRQAAPASTGIGPSTGQAGPGPPDDGRDARRQAAPAAAGPDDGRDARRPAPSGVAAVPPDDEEALRQLRIGGSNGALAAIFGSERHLLRHMNLPFGVSLYAIARLDPRR